MSSGNKVIVAFLIALVIGLGVALALIASGDDGNSDTSTTSTTEPTTTTDSTTTDSTTTTSADSTTTDTQPQGNSGGTGDASAQGGGQTPPDRISGGLDNRGTGESSGGVGAP